MKNKKNKNSNSPWFVRQGDVLVMKTNKIPENKTQLKKATLALGEATGHHHSIFSESCTAFADEPGTSASTQTLVGGAQPTTLASFLVVEGAPAELEHQEHATISLPPGNYEVFRQVEYTPEALKNVQD